MADIVSTDPKTGQITWSDGTITDMNGNPLGSSDGSPNSPINAIGATTQPGTTYDPANIGAATSGDGSDTGGTLPTNVQQILSSGAGLTQQQIAGLGTMASGLAAGAVLAPQLTQAGQASATMANPWGSGGNYQTYINKLNALEADPNSVTNTPGYQFSLQQGLNAIQNKDDRSFGLGAGSTNVDAMNYAEGLAQQTYNNTFNQYAQMAGVNLNPSAGATDLLTGALGSVGEQQSGINAAITGASQLLTPTAGSSSGSGTSTTPTSTTGLTPAQLQNLHLNLGSGSGGTIVANNVTPVNSNDSSIYNQGGNQGGLGNSNPDDGGSAGQAPDIP